MIKLVETKSRQMRKFQKIVQQAALLDLDYHSPAFTWSNNQHNGNLIMQLLDRALATTTWTSLFPSTTVYHLPRFNNDHHPVLLRTSPPPPRIQRRFKTKNQWMFNPNFNSLCVEKLLASQNQLGKPQFKTFNLVLANELRNYLDLTGISPL